MCMHVHTQTCAFAWVPLDLELFWSSWLFKLYHLCLQIPFLWTGPRPFLCLLSPLRLRGKTGWSDAGFLHDKAMNLSLVF